jgi:hypothetical protein
MGVREFNAVLEETASRGRTDPESWDGADRDPFWNHERHRR